MQVHKFKDYLTEAKGDKKFLRLLIITDEPEEAKTFHTADRLQDCLLYTSPSPRDAHESRMPSSA